ncbi:hypothetical protein A3K42_00360 [candidate division WWE3 bacterium RBG_13_37_7]|uniref:Uncharacterized protein n=1 Tax=candidate division WWE3 bacterium RBG_13_37_7 TaxID=1802609 RepID=A0A1F4U257_UNCKA|nr:MAG: hypothetical protein A3K42_00360 [candidate division WWE3 bacterium RBG_13_37_7]
MDNKQIIDAQIRQLNKEFYDNFNPKYFRQKLSFLLVLLSDVDYLSKKYEEGIEIGKIKALGDRLTNEEKIHLAQVIKGEIALTYYHAIETFFRLFIAHATNSDCPWVEISNLTTFSNFKQQLERINKFKFPKDAASFEKLIINVMFGNKPPKEANISTEKWTKNIANTKDWIFQFSSDLLKNLDYNAYKHGLAIFSTEIGFELEDTPIKQEKSEAFAYITKKKEKNEVYFYKTFKFINWEEKTAFIFKVCEMMQNIINVGKIRYLRNGQATKIKLFDDIKITDLFKEEIRASEMSMSLPFKLDIK